MPVHFNCSIQIFESGSLHFLHCLGSCTGCDALIPSSTLFGAFCGSPSKHNPCVFAHGTQSLFGSDSTGMSSSCHAALWGHPCRSCLRRLLPVPSLACQSMLAGRRWIVLGPVRGLWRTSKPVSLAAPSPTQPTIPTCPCRSQRIHVHINSQLQCVPAHGECFAIDIKCKRTLEYGIGTTCDADTGSKYGSLVSRGMAAMFASQNP